MRLYPVLVPFFSQGADSQADGMPEINYII